MNLMKIWYMTEGTELETEQRIFEMVREELGSRGDVEEEEEAAVCVRG